MFQIDPRHLPGQGSATEEGEGMNCKQGDLAVVAKLTNQNLLPHMGRIVRCVRISRRDDRCWVTEPELQPGAAVYDGCLRPIRDSDGEDETLTWAGKPEAVPA